MTRRQMLDRAREDRGSTPLWVVAASWTFVAVALGIGNTCAMVLRGAPGASVLASGAVFAGLAALPWLIGLAENVAFWVSRRRLCEGKSAT